MFRDTLMQIGEQFKENTTKSCVHIKIQVFSKISSSHKNPGLPYLSGKTTQI